MQLAERPNAGIPSIQKLLEMTRSFQLQDDGATAERAIGYLIGATERDHSAQWQYGRTSSERYVGSVYDEPCRIQIDKATVEFPIGILTADAAHRFCRSATKLPGRNSRAVYPSEFGSPHTCRLVLDRLWITPPDNILERDLRGNIPVGRGSPKTGWSHQDFHRRIVAVGRAAQANGERRDADYAWALLFTCALHSESIKMVCKTPAVPMENERRRFYVAPKFVDRSVKVERDLFRLVVPGAGGFSIPAEKLTKGARVMFLRCAQLEGRPPRADVRRDEPLEFPHSGGFKSLNASVPDGILNAA